MLEISTKYKFNVNFNDAYKEKCLSDPSDIESLHKHILALIYSFKTGTRPSCIVHGKLLADLYNALATVAYTNNAEPYEALFFYEFNKALKKNDVNTVWLQKNPQYESNCLLNDYSFKFLKHIGLFEAAEIVCQNLYDAHIYTSDKYIQRKTDMLCKQNKHNEAFDFLVGIIKDKKGHVESFVFNKAHSLCWRIRRVNEMLEICREYVSKQKHIKWISKEYISLCLKLKLVEEASAEYERFVGLVLFLYKDSEITKENSKEFNFLLCIRKLLNKPCTPEKVALELGLEIDDSYFTADEKNHVSCNTDCEENHVSPWINDLNNKSILKKSFKINKPFKTYTKLFSGGERELIHAKGLLASYMSIIKRRFFELFDTENFEVTDYEAFYNAFPFYRVNRISKEAVENATDLLFKLYSTVIQLNPFVYSRHYVLDPALHLALSAYTKLELKKKKYEYTVVAEGTQQITLFGVILLITTFLTATEKVAFSFDLAEADLSISTQFLKQILNTILPAKLDSDASLEAKKQNEEKAIFSLMLRKELFRFLLEFEAAIIKKNNLLDTEKPNMNPKSFRQLLLMEFFAYTEELNTLRFLHDAASDGVLISNEYKGERFTVQQIVSALEKCRENKEFGRVFQAEVDMLFTLLVNLKYYDVLKWKNLGSNNSVFNKQTSFCRKMMYRNDVLLRADDENLLYSCSSSHVFTYINDFQRRNFRPTFGSKTMEWEKIEFVILKFDLTRCKCKINGKELQEQYILLHPDDVLAVVTLNGKSLTEWKTVKEFDSSLARCTIKELIL